MDLSLDRILNELLALPPAAAAVPALPATAVPAAAVAAANNLG